MSDPAAQVVDVTQLLDRLAALPRTGWLLRGVSPAESIAEHTLGVALVASMLVDDLRARGLAVDGERVLRMAVVHDAAEVFTGDIPMPAKTEALDRALAEAERGHLARALPEAMLALWDEAEACASLEARVVKAADKVQMLVKALTYEEQGRARLDDFWKNPASRKDMGLELARAVFDELDRRAGIVRGDDAGRRRA
jgi:putative hydrolase of HD superfamily